jgi:adenylate cyclase
MSDVSQRFGDVLVSLGFVTRSQVQEALALQHLTGHRVGEALLSLGYITRAQLQRALSHALSAGNRVALDRPPLGEILVGLKYLEEPVLNATLERQREDGRRLGEVLVEEGLVTHQQIYEALGLQHRMADHAPAADEAPPAAPRESSNGVKVMVVDDSLLACNLVEQGLTLLGYEVQSWQDPFLALEAVGTFGPSIVLTDLEMPGIDGAEVCRRLKQGPTRSLPVMILTANDVDVQRVSGLRAGADDYVNKGVSMDELAARMENILKRTNETDRIRRLFARYTSDAVVDEILKSGEVVLSGEKRDVTVLFADIRNFTSIAETYPPDQVMGLLNGVLGRLTDAVLAHGGTLDKFLGDGVMAVFGAPVAHDDDAARAVRAALQMMDSVREQNTSGEHVTPLELGIGINTGLVVAGSVGSARRTEYTCIGDAVNIAARLCSLAGGGEILVGASTAERAAKAGWESELLPPVKLKGKAQPVPLYRVTTPRSADFA